MESSSRLCFHAILLLPCCIFCLKCILVFLQLIELVALRHRSNGVTCLLFFRAQGFPVRTDGACHIPRHLTPEFA